MRLNASGRVRRRIKEIIEERGWSQKAVADALNRTQPWMSQLLAGAMDLRLADLDDLALSLGTNAVELVRDPEQFQFCADLTPSEMLMVRQFRRLSPSAREAVQTLVAAVDTTRRSPGSHASRRALSEPPVTAETYRLASELDPRIRTQANTGGSAAGTRQPLPPARKGHRNRRA